MSKRVRFSTEAPQIKIVPRSCESRYAMRPTNSFDCDKCLQTFDGIKNIKECKQCQLFLCKICKYKHQYKHEFINCFQ